MNDIVRTLCGILLPFLGTAAGAAAVFFMKAEMNDKTKNSLFGFASGVMLAASVWSLLLPALDLGKDGGIPAFIPAAVGFLAGVLFILLLEKAADAIENRAERTCSKRSANTMLIIAVTLHNLPEGMAVGVVFAGLLSGSGVVTFASAMTLSAGIALQNLPEGAIISMPLAAEGKSKERSFVCGALSGAVEPAGAVLTVLLASLVGPALPWLLSFAAGAMVYVVVKELIPRSQTDSEGTLSALFAAAGFVLMMTLDVVFG